MKNHGSALSPYNILAGQTERIASVSPAGSVRVMAKLLVLASFALIIAGSLVVSNKAGLADPNWPLFLDGWYPKNFQGGLVYVYAHRLLVVLVGILTLAQAVLIQVNEPRRFMKKLGWGAVALIVTQALFGAVVLKSVADPFLSMLHAVLAQVFFSTTIAMAVLTSRTWFLDMAAPLVQRVENRGYIGFLKFAVAVLFLQVILGGGVRHSSDAADLFLPFIGAHVAGAFMAIFTVAWYFMRTWQVYRDVTPLMRTARWATALICYQVVFGILAIFSNRARITPELAQMHHVLFSTAHIVGGTTLLALMFVTLLRAHRLLDLTDYSPAPVQARPANEVNL